MKWVLRARDRGARVVVVDPRFTRTAASADLYCRIRPGTDVAFLGALISWVIENGRIDEGFVRSRTDALFRVAPGFGFESGRFSGFDPGTGRYDPSSWTLADGPDGRPQAAAALDEPDTVFAHLRRHFARFTLEHAEERTGIPRAKIEETARLLADRRPGAVWIAAGVTQHTTGGAAARAAAILQLLLGNAGAPGGGVGVGGGAANLQGASDVGSAAGFLPGHLPLPTHEEPDLGVWTRRHGTAARRHLISLLRAWFGEAATRENDWGYGWLPRRDGRHPTGATELWRRADAKAPKAAVILGRNPLVSAADAGAVSAGLARLETLVVIDPLESETAAFWRAPGVKPAGVKTEVIHLPTAWTYEKAGSLTNASRWIQWRAQALPAPAGLPADLQVIDRIFRRVRALVAERSEARDAPIRAAAWEYGEPADPERVLAEIGGKRIADGRPLAGTADLLRDGEGETACGCRFYAGVTGDGNRAARREVGGPEAAATRPGWSWSWPDNARILHERVGGESAGGPNAEPAFPECPAGVARLFAGHSPSPPRGPDGLTRPAAAPADGPFPEHYEPIESVVAGAHAQDPSPTAVARARQAGVAAAGEPAKFPYLLTTFDLAEHFGSGPTRHEPWLSELVPAPFLEISTSLAQRLALRSGDPVRVISDRGSLDTRALVTPRLRPIACSGETVEIVALPWGWGFQGLARGAGANALTIAAPEPGSGTPETKVCRVNVEKIAKRNL